MKVRDPASSNRSSGPLAWAREATVHGIRLAACFAVLGSSGCQFFFPTPIDQSADATTPAPAVRVVDAGFEPGERFVAEVRLDDLVVATGSLEVAGRCVTGGRPALEVATEVRSGGLLTLFKSGHSETRGLIDVDTAMPIESLWDVTLGDRRTVIEVDFAQGAYRYHQTRHLPDEPKPKQNHRKVVMPLEQVPHDGHSVLGHLRSWDPPDGTRGYVYALMGKNLWRADLVFVGREPVSTDEGLVGARRIDGVATRTHEKTFETVRSTAPRPFSLWISDDERKIPLRILMETDVAKITLAVVEHEVRAVPDGPLEPCPELVDPKELAKAKPFKKAAPKEAEPLDAEEEERREREEIKKRLLERTGIRR